MAPNTHNAVCAGTHEPRLRRHPPNLEHAHVVSECMPAEYLKGDDEWVREEVAVDTCVEDMHGTVVGAGREEGECWVECDRADRAGVISIIAEEEFRREMGWDGIRTFVNKSREVGTDEP